MQIELFLPILIPFVTAVLCLILLRNVRMQKIISFAGSFLFLLTSVFLLYKVNTQEMIVMQAGNWQAPFGISLVADLFSALMVAITGIIGFAVAVYSNQSIDAERMRYGFFPLYHFLLMGVTGSFLAGDIFNLYVWFEVMLIASFVLLSLGGTKHQLNGTIKYMIINFIASSIFLTGIGMVYGITGSLNMADVALAFSQDPTHPLINVSAVFFIVAFGIKSAVFPLYFWLPASYPAPPISISAIFSGLLTKVGVYTLVRFFTLIYVHDVSYTHTILLYIAAFTMISGVLGAVARNEIREILSFHIISQIGYMIMGLALFIPLALGGAIFYIIHHILVKTNLFLMGGIVRSLKGSFYLNEIGGIYKKYPFISYLFLIPALSLAGIPPLSGFWAKLAVIRASLSLNEYVVAFIALLTGILTIYSMTKIWNEAFWKKEPPQSEKLDVYIDEKQFLGKNWIKVLPATLLAIGTLIIGFYPEWLFDFSMRSAEQLLNPEIYINFVMNNPLKPVQ